MATINSDNTYITLGANEELLLPTQPCFIAQCTAPVADVTGDSSVYTCSFDSEIVDRGANFSLTTFTAPKSGYYLLIGNISLSNLGAAHVDCVTTIVTTGGSYSYYVNPYAYATGCSYGTIRNNALCYMAATDTAYLTVQVSGSTKTVAFYGNAVASSTFSGTLIS